jgi:hypothetical protein
MLLVSLVLHYDIQVKYYNGCRVSGVAEWSDGCVQTVYVGKEDQRTNKNVPTAKRKSRNKSLKPRVALASPTRIIKPDAS